MIYYTVKANGQGTYYLPRIKSTPYFLPREIPAPGYPQSLRK